MVNTLPAVVSQEMQSAHLCGCEKDCQWPVKNGRNSHQMKRALNVFKLVQDPLHLQPYLNDQVCGLVTISRSAQYHWNKSLEYMPKIHICFVIRNFLCAHSILVPHDFISGGHSVGQHTSIHTYVCSSDEVPEHSKENAWKEWPRMWHHFYKFLWLFKICFVPILLSLYIYFMD